MNPTEIGKVITRFAMSIYFLLSNKSLVSLGYKLLSNGQ
jgi:hypothetical protein